MEGKHKEIWYYQYKIEVWDDIDEKLETVNGIVPGKSFADVTKRLENYYGEETINRIFNLTPVTEGPVLEFEWFNYNSKKENAATFDITLREGEN